jgi:hypothetical protein
MIGRSHIGCVNAWMDRGAGGLPPERLVQAFEEAFGALWRRAHQTLGDVTLTAILDRVLCNGAERFPILSELRIEATGLDCRELRKNAHGAPPNELADAIRFVLVEFLRVLGSLTANILTPALHAELSMVAPQGRRPKDKKSEGEPRSRARKARKDPKS